MIALYKDQWRLNLNLFGQYTTEELFQAVRFPDVGQSSVVLKQDKDLSRTAAETTKKLKSFRSLTRNWDSYGAEKPSAKAIDQAIIIIRRLDEWDQPVFFTAPGPNGEILIELKCGNKSIEIYSHPEGQQEFFLFDGSNCIDEGDFTIDVLPRILDWLHENANAVGAN